MKIRIVSTKDEIKELDHNEKIVHLAFRPSDMDVFTLVKTCPEIEMIQLPGSYKRTVSKSVKMFLEMQNIRLVEGDVWGHRKDINEYYSIAPSIKENINTFLSEGKSEDEIVDLISRENKISKDMVKYMLETV